MDLSEDEKKLCQQFRDRISDLKVNDNYRIADYNAIRFLRARDMDMDKAEDMFRKYQHWREENDIDTARSWDVPQDLKENFKYRICGLSREGGLVISANVGDWNPAICHGRYEELMKVAYHDLENLASITRYFTMKANRFSKMVAIINLQGLTFAHCSSVEWIRALITLLKAFEANYPETLKVAFLINAPWVFSILWSIAKPFISTNTHQRLRFIGADKETWRDNISEYVAEDQFAEVFGGLLPDDYELVWEGEKIVGKRVVDEKAQSNGNEESPQKPVDSIELD